MLLSYKYTVIVIEILILTYSVAWLYIFHIYIYIYIYIYIPCVAWHCAAKPYHTIAKRSHFEVALHTLKPLWDTLVPMFEELISFFTSLEGPSEPLYSHVEVNDAMGSQRQCVEWPYATIENLFKVLQTAATPYWRLLEKGRTSHDIPQIQLRVIYFFYNCDIPFNWFF